MKLDTISEQLSQSSIEVLHAGGAPIACPTNVEQAQEVLARAAESDLRVVPAGLGSKLGWCRPEVSAGEPLLVLSTRRMDQVLEYVAGDGTLSAQCGASMRDLALHVSQGGHQLTPDVANPAGATLGGVLSAGQSGIDRMLYGPVRHHVLGVSALLADGKVARSGGRLVKNVTGFDLHRLYTGSRGTLCVLLEASMRLFSIPEDERAFSFTCADEAQLDAQVLALWQARLPVLAMVVEPTGDASGAQVLHLLLAGRKALLDATEQRIAALTAAATATTGDAARALRQRLRDAANVRYRQPAFEPTNATTPAAQAANKTAQAWMSALRKRFDPSERFACPTFPVRPA
ncbi:MAG: FAD/FMN-containing dehydrogenase [Planctomycetota bacterium]|jgi:FAD/FMN-containing dehydrogenase